MPYLIALSICSALRMLTTVRICLGGPLRIKEKQLLKLLPERSFLAVPKNALVFDRWLYHQHSTFLTCSRPVVFTPWPSFATALFRSLYLDKSREK